MKKIVWIIPKNPFPVDDGAKRAMQAILLPIAKLTNLHLVILKRKDDKPIDLSLKKIWNLKSISIIETKASSKRLHRIKSAFKSILGSKTPMTYMDYVNTGVLSELEVKLKELRPEVVISDTLHSSVCCLLLDIKFIYRAHNIESLIWKRLSEQTPSFLKKKLIDFEYKKVLQIESEVINKSIKTFFISKDDRDYYAKKNLALSSQLSVLPVGFTIKELSSKETTITKDEITLLFLGNLDWAPNVQGLTWFLTNVWSKLLKSHSNIRIVIAGSGDGAWLSPYLSLKNLNFLGRVENVEEAYEKADLIISPIFFGSGVRIKALEAAAFGKVCISTTMGMEGSGFSEAMFFKANSEKEWGDVLQNVTKEKINLKKQEVLKFMSLNYSPTKIASNFLDQI